MENGRRHTNFGAMGTAMCRGIVFAVIVTILSTSCTPRTDDTPPNVLLIVWDTVRADRLSLYGHDRPTTPFLDEWARDARVFDDCLSVASTTVPAHGSLFTDLMPWEHGADNDHCFLPTDTRTLAEIFLDHGYQTFMYAENPFIARETGFGQGFDVVAHPWDEKHRARTISILEGKIPKRFRHPQLAQLLGGTDTKLWSLSACGGLGEEVTTAWLSARDTKKPFFTFLNYMEAHQPIITPLRYRERVLGRERATQSYKVNTLPVNMWRHTFGLAEYSATELALIQGVYDSAISELDEEK